MIKEVQGGEEEGPTTCGFGRAPPKPLLVEPEPETYCCLRSSVGEKIPVELKSPWRIVLSCG